MLSMNKRQPSDMWPVNCVREPFAGDAAVADDVRFNIKPKHVSAAVYNLTLRAVFAESRYFSCNRLSGFVLVSLRAMMKSMAVLKS